jgi:porphobilinogen synthase
MTHKNTFPYLRPRRLRHHPQVRNLVKETRLSLDNLILPLFIRHGQGHKIPINSMLGHHQFSVDKLAEEIKEVSDLGIKAVLLFGVPESKDPFGKDSYSEDGIIQQAIPVIKKAAPELLVISDICLCEYTDHGHCGVIRERDGDKTIDNDPTLELLAKQAVSHAQAGADVIAPSGMMDGMVQAIRHALDAADFAHLPILSYAVKYASNMYGPFREAAQGAPKFGDRRTYQMDYANATEALRESALDVSEGADMLMVKPAHTYLDIIYRIKQAYPEFSLGAYHTSGEFAMLKAAAQKGWIDERNGVMEILTAIRRAGADFIFTYYAKEVAAWLQAE